MSKTTNNGLGNMEIFSRNLKRYVALSGAKQKDVAAVIGVSTGTFTDWVKGRAYPRMDKLQRLADYFGIKKSDLVEDKNVTSETISDAEQQILDLFHRVPKEKREFVLSMIRAAIENL